MDYVLTIDDNIYCKKCMDINYPSYKAKTKKIQDRVAFCVFCGYYYDNNLDADGKANALALLQGSHLKLEVAIPLATKIDTTLRRCDGFRFNNCQRYFAQDTHDRFYVKYDKTYCIECYRKCRYCGKFDSLDCFVNCCGALYCDGKCYSLHNNIH